MNELSFTKPDSFDFNRLHQMFLKCVGTDETIHLKGMGTFIIGSYSVNAIGWIIEASLFGVYDNNIELKLEVRTEEHRATAKVVNGGVRQEFVF